MDGVAETDATVVIASHVIADIERVCDYIVLLSDGRVRLEGNVESLLESHCLLTGAKRPLGKIRNVTQIVRERHSGRQSTLLVRNDGADRRPDVGRRSRRARGTAARVHGAGPRAGADRADAAREAAASMAWVTWRQHRSQLVAGLALLVGLAATALATHLPIHAAYHRDAVAGCLPPSARAGCDLIVRHFESEFGGWAAAARGLAVLPALVGLFVGAPLLARELEHGTHRFAWTQAVTRRRWLLSKTAFLALGTVAAARRSRAR